MWVKTETPVPFFLRDRDTELTTPLMSFESGNAYCHVVPSVEGDSLAVLQSDGHAVRIGAEYIPHQPLKAWPVEIVLAVADDLLAKRKKEAEAAAESKEKPLIKMNTGELEAKAEKLGVDLSGAKNNKQRAALIAEAIEKG